MENSQTISKIGEGTGIAASLAGLLSAGWLVAQMVLPYLSVSSVGVRIANDAGDLGAENAPIIAFWSAVIVGLSLLTAYVVRTENLRALWGLAVVLPVLAILSLFSFGLAVVPFAVLVVLSALFVTLGRRVGGSEQEDQSV